ncbi:MAG: VUT family protein [Thermomicrobiales bacterium]
MSDRSGSTSLAVPALTAWFRLPDRAAATFGAMAIYIAAVLLANETTTHFFSLPWYGLVSVGTLIFGITFTQRDRVHRAGRPWVYAMLIVTVILSTLQSWLTDVSWRIIVASCLAILLAEAADTEVFHHLRQRSWTVRVMGSNAISIPLDTLIFTIVAFAGVFSWGMIWSIVWGDIVAKTAIGTAFAFLRGYELGREKQP